MKKILLVLCAWLALWVIALNHRAGLCPSCYSRGIETKVHRWGKPKPPMFWFCRDCKAIPIIRPLAEPVTKQFDMSRTHTTLEYTVPTYQSWECAVHGEITEVYRLRKGDYCPFCLLEKLLAL